jgi:hemolysin III
VDALTLHESSAPAELSSAVQINLIEQSAGLDLQSPAWRRTATDERLNSLTHGSGFVLASIGAYLMTSRMAGHGDLLIAGCFMYLVSLLGVYSMSTMSHAATVPHWKSLYRQLDQGFIYLLIVASYTPYSIAYLHGPMWTALLCGMWAFAVGGFIAKVVFKYDVEAVSVVPPLILAWVPIVAMPTLAYAAPEGAYDLIIAGGVAYSTGIWFFINDSRASWFHSIWHLCVIAGSTCHFFGILNYVLA